MLVPITVRLDEAEYEELRRLAFAAHKQPAVLAREFITGKIREARENPQREG